MERLACLLDFRGELGRGPFLRMILMTLASGGAVIALIAIIGFALSVVTVTRQGLVGTSLFLGAVSLSLVGLSCLALAARRLRDIGLDPLLVLPAWVAFTQFDALVLARTGHFSLTTQTPFGAGIGIALFLLLVLWPGRAALAAAEMARARVSALPR